MDILRNRSRLTNSLGHMFVDVFASITPVMLAFLSVPMSLTNAQIALAASLFTFFSSLLQPAFGWLADRYGSRWLGAGGLLWLMVFMSLVMVAGERGTFSLVVILLCLAGVGSAAFHPQGVMNAANVEQSRQTTGVSMFFFFGNVGMTLGPALTGLILTYAGPSSFPLLAVAGLPVVWLLATSTHSAAQPRNPDDSSSPSSQSRAPLAFGVVVALTALVVLRSWATFTTITFLPKFYQELGWGPARYGLVASIWTLGSALGNVLGGPAADRWGRRLVVSISLGLIVPLLLFLPYARGTTPFVVAALGGVLCGLSFSVVVVLAQTLLPGGKGFASGITMGAMFASGAAGNIVSGWIADDFGLTRSLQSLAFVALGAALCAQVLPGTRPAAEP